MKTLLLIITIVSNFPVIIVGMGAILLVIFIFLLCRNRQRKVRCFLLILSKSLFTNSQKSFVQQLWSSYKNDNIFRTSKRSLFLNLSASRKHLIFIISLNKSHFMCELFNILIMSLKWHVRHLVYICLLRAHLHEGASLLYNV